MKVFFSIKNKVGLTEMNLASDGQTITLYDPTESLNVIMTEGAVELLAVSADEISGRIDAQFDADNYVNGNFKVSFCE